MRRLASLPLLLLLAACDSSDEPAGVEPRFAATAEGAIEGMLAGRAYANGDGQQWLLIVELDVEPSPSDPRPFASYGGFLSFRGGLRPAPRRGGSISVRPHRKR